MIPTAKFDYLNSQEDISKSLGTFLCAKQNYLEEIILMNQFKIIL